MKRQAESPAEGVMDVLLMIFMLTPLFFWNETFLRLSTIFADNILRWPLAGYGFSL